MRSEKGSITIYVLLAMLTLTAFLIAIYIKDSNEQTLQVEAMEKIKAIYGDYNIDEVYNRMTSKAPRILGYIRGANTIIIKTLKEEGVNVDQNGKEILYYAATKEAAAPNKESISETKGEFGKWQKSKEISIPFELEDEDIYVWIYNENGDISDVSDLISASSARIEAGEYAKEVHKKYVDPTDNTKTAYIPAGFTVSNVAEETSISKGLVIYSGDQSNVTDMTQIQNEVNQYVWIPVENPSDMYGLDSNGNKTGKLYNFDTNGGMTAVDWVEENGIMKWNKTNTYQEPYYLNGDNSIYNQDENGNPIMTQSGIQKEFNDLIASIERYHGFYIGRYELTGSKEKPTITKETNPLADQNWYSFYQACKQLEDTSTQKIYTSMVWGCQWDQAIRQALTSNADFISNSSRYGVYKDSTISRIGITGRMESAYQIFDMGGNLQEWTTEAYNKTRRAIRGGCYSSTSSSFSATSRRSYQGSDYQHFSYGCRAQLYLL